MSDKTFEELSSPPGIEHAPWHGVGLCGQLPAGHPICSATFPGGGHHVAHPLTPVPEAGSMAMMVVGLVAIAALKWWRR